METREQTEAREKKLVDDTKRLAQSGLRKLGINITNPLAGLDSLPTTEESLDPDSLKIYQDANKPIEQAQGFAKEGFQLSAGLYGAALSQYGTVGNQPRNMINITDQVEEIVDMHPSIYKRAGSIYRNHEGGISWKQAIAMAKSLPQGTGPNDPTVYIPPNERIGTQKGDPLQSVNPDQLEFFGDEEAISKNLPEFITYPMKKDMPAYSKEVPEGYFDYHKMKNWFYASETGGRKAIETGMTPVVPGTQISRGISFSGLAKAQLPKLRKNFAPILKALKIDQKESASIHHIAALKATYGILHKVQVDSPLFREVYDVLLEHIPGLGNMKGNLVPVIGMTKGKKQVSTPHNIVHRFYSDKIGESGELFFTDEVLERMVHDKAFRIEKAHELGRFIARSEKIVKDAQQIWRIAFSQEKINFNEIVNRLSELDELGYSKLADIEYQTPALSEMIKDIVLDIKLEKDQLKRLTPQSEDFSDIGKANVVKEGTLEEERQRLKRIRQNKSKHKPQKGQFSFDFLNDIFD